MTEFFQLPVLEVPCPECTGEAGNKMRAAAYADLCAWHDRVDARRLAWEAARKKAGHDYGDLAWRHSEALAALGPRPDDVAEAGCVECDWTSVKLTDQGRALLDFMRRHGGTP